MNLLRMCLCRDKKDKETITEVKAPGPDLKRDKSRLLVFPFERETRDPVFPILPVSHM
jgi:hypothetical protein